MKTYIIAIAAAAALASFPARSSDAMQTWNDLPEHQTSDWIEECTPHLKWATSIASLLAKGATPVQMLRWAEGEAEKGASLDPDPRSLYPLGVQTTLIKLIEVAIVKDVYESVPGGFPQFAYRSCLKGKPLDE
jgi:hypothetical protein